MVKMMMMIIINCFGKCLTIFSAVTIVKKIFSYDFSVENLVFIEMLT